MRKIWRAAILFRMRIIRGIDACQEAIVLISPNSVNSQWVSFEIGGVRAQHKRVTPILNNVRPDDMAPMKDIKSIDLNKFELFLAQLKRRIDLFAKNSLESIWQWFPQFQSEAHGVCYFSASRTLL